MAPGAILPIAVAAVVVSPAGPAEGADPCAGGTQSAGAEPVLACGVVTMSGSESGSVLLDVPGSTITSSFGPEGSVQVEGEGRAIGMAPTSDPPYLTDPVLPGEFLFFAMRAFQPPFDGRYFDPAPCGP